MSTEPDIDRDGWTLESAVERHLQHPDRFAIPSEQERNHIRPGQRVKLLFLLLDQDEDGPILQCERMWVTVTAVHDSRYIGRLESLPATSDALKPGDLISFRPEHIAAVFIEKPRPGFLSWLRRR